MGAGQPAHGNALAYVGGVPFLPTQARRAHTLAMNSAAVAPHKTCTPDRYASIGANITQRGRNHANVVM